MAEVVTNEGKRLIDAWLGAQESLRRAKQHVNSCERDVMNTEIALAKWMLPADAKPGEKIAIWHIDSLIQVEVGEQDHRITVRTRGNHLQG